MTESLHSLHLLDVLVVLGYLAVSLGLGFAFSGQSSREEFFSAGRSMGRVVVGLSVMATLFSANSFVMYPSTAYGNSLRIFMAVVAFWLMGPLVAWVFIPVYSRLQCETAYAYLEKRFHLSVRCLASGLFILLRISWMAAATFAASVAISGISGWNSIAVIIGLGVVAILYTMLGGLRAVMWTDVLQFFVFVGTILFAAGLLIYQSDTGVTGIAKTYFSGRSNLLFDFRFDPTLRFGTVAILVGSFLEALSAFGADQVAVQRYIAARDEQTSKAGFLINLLSLLLVIPGLLAIGMGLFAYFDAHPQDLTPVVMQKLEAPGGDARVATIRQKLRARPGTAESTSESTAGASGAALTAESVTRYYRDRPRELHEDVVALGLNDQALPQFVKRRFPPGVLGLLVAALMAATMSSIDSGIHSITTALVVDFRDRLFPTWKPASERAEMLAARALVVIIGSLAITLACFVGQLGDVFAVAKKTVGAFAAPLLAVFVLGLFVRRATARGVFFGTWIGAALTLGFMYRFENWFSMWFFPVGFFTAFGLSLLLSFLPGRRWETNPEAAGEFTYWDVRQRGLQQKDV